MHHPAPTPAIPPNRREALMALLGTALLPACGGGGTGLAGISSGGTGSFTTGVVVGLGSVIVNGIRYDDRNATVRLNGGVGQPGDLQLGMVVRIQGSAVTAATTAGKPATAEASLIDCSSEWKGLITSVGADRFTLNGLTVMVAANTVFEGGPLGSGLVGFEAEVYGFVDASTGALQASRVERLDSPASSYHLSGVVTQLATSTFALGTAIIDFRNASGASGLQNGQLVRVELQTSPNASGHWVATAVRTAEVRQGLQDKDEAEVEGLITAFGSPTSFSVNGVPIDASRLTPPAGLALGVRVEVKGSVLNGSVMARAIEIEDEQKIENREYEFHGTVSSLDTVAKTFVVRGYTVRYDGTTTIEPPTLSLANGLALEVKARLNPSGQLVATKIEADH